MPRSEDAWNTFEERVLNLIGNFHAPDVLELGGGRRPLFSEKDIPTNVNTYTVNDISQKELDLLPSYYKQALFDVCGNTDGYEEKYDLIFSKMLAEHVSDGSKMHQNIYRMLKPGGIAFHFHPKLYASPFIINFLLPEALSRSLLFKFFPNRKEDIPKFPARYSWCKGSKTSIESRLNTVGFSAVDAEPFYGHSYYRKIPILNSIEKMATSIYMKNEVSTFATFVFLKTQK